MASAQKPWLTTAVQHQQHFCDKFGDVDWDKYEENERGVLKDKVKVILCGFTDEEPNEETQKLIDDICEVIVNEGTHSLFVAGKSTKKATYMIFIFVVGSSDGEKVDCCWPVFKVPKDTLGVRVSFIDVTCRVYESWEDFLENNKFPACEYSYPRNGIYYTEYDNVAVDFGQSPEAQLSKKVLSALDVTSTGVALGSTALTIASFFVPVAGPLLTASIFAMGGVSVYSAGRSTKSLHDRKTHKQSIGLQDAESRNCYINIAGGMLGLGAAAATSATVRMAQSGQVMGRFATSAVTTLNASALVINGVGIANGFYHIIEKHRNDQLTTLDVVQFSASLLLFCHSTVNFRTANAIIENTQNDVLNDFGKSLRSNRHRNVYKKTIKNTTQKHGNTEGKALVIRSVQHINSVDDFFAALVRTDKSFRYTRTRARFAEGGFIRVDNGRPLDPRQLSQLSKEQRVTFLRATQKYSMNKLSDARLTNITEAMLGEVPSTASASTATLKYSTSEKSLDGTHDKNSSSEYLSVLLYASQLSELQVLLSQFPGPFRKIILELSKRLFETLNLSQGSEFMNITHFISKLVQHLILLALDGQRKYLLSILKHKIRNVPPEDMSSSEYCLAILEQLLLYPSDLVDIYNCIKSFFDVLSEKSPILQQDSQVDFLELISATGILLKMDRQQWNAVIDFAIQSFQALGYTKFSSLVAIVKQLCLYIQQVVLDMEERYCVSSMNTVSEDDTSEGDESEDDKSEGDRTEDDKSEDDKREDDKREDDESEDDKREDDESEDDTSEDYYDDAYENFCSIALVSLHDEEVYKSLMNTMKINSPEAISEEK